MLKENLSDFFIGQTASMNRTFTQEDVKAYIALTRDENVVYLQHDGSKNNPFKGIVVPGLLTEGLVVETITKNLPTNPGVMLQKDVVYTHPVYIGDSITAKVEVIDIDFKRKWITIMVTCINQDGRNVITAQVVAMFFTE